MIVTMIFRHNTANADSELRKIKTCSDKVCLGEGEQRSRIISVFTGVFLRITNIFLNLIYFTPSFL